MIDKVQWIKGEMQLADPLTKLGVCTDKIENAVSRDQELIKVVYIKDKKCKQNYVNSGILPRYDEAYHQRYHQR